MILAKPLRRFLADERGATAIEYGLIVALLSIVVVAAVTAAGTNIYETLNKVANATNK